MPNMGKKIGPLPVWGWSLAVGLGVLLLYMRHRAAAAAGATSTPGQAAQGPAIDPKTGLPFALENVDPQTGLPYYLSQTGGSSAATDKPAATEPPPSLEQQLGSLAGVISAVQGVAQLFNPPAASVAAAPQAPAPAAPPPAEYNPLADIRRAIDAGTFWKFSAPGVTLARGQYLNPGAIAIYHGDLGQLRQVGSTNKLGWHPIIVHGHHVKA